MVVIELLLPLRDNEGNAFQKSAFDAVRGELAKRFGGVTAFLRAPAVGVWTDEDGVPRRDDIVVFEVMAETIDVQWWRDYRVTLEREFRQEEVLVRATTCQRL